MNAFDVLKGARNWAVEVFNASDWLRCLPSACVDLVFFSPPYEDCRLYGTGFKLKGQDWVNWLRAVVRECARVSKGLVAINMASPVKKGSYTAAVEWLVADLTRIDGLVCGPSPYCWIKSEDDVEAPGNGQPGSGAKHYHRRDWEPIYCFAEPDKLPGRGAHKFWSDQKAYGKKPKYRAGGAPSHRDKHGVRANARGAIKHTKRGKAGMVDQVYLPPKISNPGNILRVPVGGGKLGCPIAHEGEAPMALGVAERFVRWFVPVGGIVADPFCGTGTTIHAARAHKRRAIGCDNRQSQIDLTCRRMAKVLPGVVLPKGAL